ncbi:MAG: extracellular solute-binding protein [Lachnospiraceae bacterium]|nr:extracellular solute-binding protein [Lachnospiraceae bacterium]
MINSGKSSDTGVLRRISFSFKKLLCCVFILGLCSTALTGCHGTRERNEFTLPDEFDTSRDYEITFWAKNDTNKTQTDIYAKAISDFEALYPNIHVTIRLYTDYGRIYNDVITNISTNTTPNVCITYPDHIATYLTGENTVVPLDAVMDDKKYGLGGSEVNFDGPTRKEIVPKFLGECMIGEHYYALPYMRSTEACYINKTYVEALGYTVPDELTWDFVWEVSDAATAKNADGTYKVNGQNVMIPFIYKSTDNMMIQYLAQKDAGYTTADGDILIFNDTAFDFLYEIKNHVEKGAFSTFKISSYPANFLNAGQCIFAIDSTAGSTWMGSKAPLSDIAADMFVDFETVVRTIPQCDPSAPKMISQGPSICIFNKEDPQEVLASWLFTQYMLTNDVQTAYAETEGYVPVTTKAQDSPEYIDYLARSGEDNKEHYDIKILATRLLLDNITNTFVTPVFNGSASVRDAAGQMIENVTKSVRRKETVDAAYMEKLQTDITSLYRLDRLVPASADGEGETSVKTELPKASKALLITLCTVWILLAGYGIYSLFLKLKKKKD